jgi:DNA invertase Pin-like site-specific DNA recombinase
LEGSEGAAYIRCSDDQQDTARQYEAIHSFEKLHGVTIPRQNYYVDQGWARDTADRRPEFQRLIAAAEQGRIKWIVVSERDRFGTADADELIHYRYLLRQWGCKLFDAAGTDWTAKNIATVITAVVEGDKSEQEQHSISRRVLGGKAESARAGEWQGGPVRLGFDIACLRRSTGEELWRVVLDGKDRRCKVFPDRDGRPAERFDGQRNFPQHQDTVEKLQLVPSRDNAKLAAAVGIFTRYATEAISFSALAQWLNGLGIRTCYGLPFQARTVQDTLADPIYLGYFTWNRTSQAKFHRYKDGRAELEPNPRRRFSRNEEAHWVQSHRLFDPLVSLETWNAVRKKLSTRAIRSKAPHSHRHYLMGLLVCGNCGVEMISAQSGRHPDPNRCEYQCGSYQRAVRYRDMKLSTCLRNGVWQVEIEEYISRWLDETGTRLELLLGETAVGGDLTGKLSEQEADHWKRFRDGLARLTAYLASHHPQQYAAVVEQFNQQHAADMAAARSATQTAKRGDLLRKYGDRLQRAFQRAKENAANANGTVDPAVYANDFVEAVVGCYRSNYDPSRARAEMETLEREHDSLMRQWADLPTPRAKEKARARFTEMEARMEELRGQTAEGADAVAAQWREMSVLQSAIADAKLAMRSGAGERAARRRAEALRRVIQRIECRFVAVPVETDSKGRRGGGRGKRGYLLVGVTIFPLVGAAVEMGPSPTSEECHPSMLRQDAKK